MEENKEEVKEETKENNEESKVEAFFKEKVLEAYKGGYLDGMIAGLYASGHDFGSIANFLKVNKDYVEKEVKTYLEMCKKAGKWAHIHPEEKADQGDGGKQENK